MGVARDGQWIVHDIDATDPDGDRISIQVVARQRHEGGVTVRWDPSGVAEPRLVGTRPWGLYAVIALGVVALLIGAWVLLT
jgi:hypothetical protein